jgi:hypothetical protein
MGREGMIMNFGGALHVLKQGGRVARLGWNGKGMYLYLVPGSKFKVTRPPLTKFIEPETEVDYLPHIDMCTVTGQFVPWLASQTDVLAEDWIVVSH